MRVCVGLEHRFERTPDGAVWTRSSFDYSFWRRYLGVFDGVKVLARVRRTAEKEPRWQRADGLGVEFRDLPWYVGPWQHVRKLGELVRRVRAAVGREDAVILRVPSAICNWLDGKLLREGRPFAVEVVGDPWEVFGPGVVEHPLRRFFRYWFHWKLKRQCGKACAAAYVTERMLQRRYPPQHGCYATACSSVQIARKDFQPAVEARRWFVATFSDVDLRPEAYVASPLEFDHRTRPYSLITVGSLEQRYKGVDLLIRAVARLASDGLETRLVVVGDGSHRRDLARLASELGVAGRVTFTGELPGAAAVRGYLDQAELFVMPSLTEGLPRAMIEAMSRALPCLGTAVGGIPELLEEEDLVPPGDWRALACKIAAVLRDPARLAHMSERNFRKSQEYSEETLAGKRGEFYGRLREVTADWLRREC